VRKGDRYLDSNFCLDYYNQLLFGSFLASLPMLLRSLVLILGLVALMTYIVMP
jgi:antibiotic biosynthesis monooxygenase (ABM) superfamily enzyme